MGLRCDVGERAAVVGEGGVGVAEGWGEGLFIYGGWRWRARVKVDGGESEKRGCGDQYAGYILWN